MSAGLCPLTDLELSMCACDLCRPDLAQADADSNTDITVATARFSSTCPVCDGRIREGDLIERAVGEQYWSHAECSR